MTGRNGREALFTGTLSAAVIGYALLILGLSGARVGEALVLLAAYLRIAGALWVFVALAALLVLLRRTSADAAGGSLVRLAGRALHDRWRRDGCVSLLAPPLLFALLVASFNLFKQTVLPRFGFGADAGLAALDRMLFGGVDPWRVTHALLPSPWATFLIDKAYHGWFAPMTLGFILCAFLPATADHLRIRYLVSFVAVWILLGSGLAILLPAAGPCFQPATIGTVPGFEPLLSHLHAQQHWLAARLPGTSLAALTFQRGLLDLHDGGSALMVGGGISAMPSIHNALAALFAMAAFRLNPTAGRVMSAYAVLIWVGSIHLGWHYAVDGLVAVALTYAIWLGAGRYADRLLAADPARTGRLAVA